MATKEQEAKRERLLSAPIPGLIGQLAIPSIISMLVSAVYNMADSWYVSRISMEATASVGVVFSYMSMIQAIGFFFGHGSASFISRALGAGRTDQAEEMASVGFFTALGCAVILASVIGIFMTPVLVFFGAIPSLLADSTSYLSFILVSTPFAILSYVLNNQLRLQGNSRLGMLGMASGAVINIGLDPVLIFGCGMGVAGASLSTCISQGIAFCILLRITKRPDCISIRWSRFRPTRQAYREIIGSGLPSLGRQGLSSIALMILNNSAGLYGEAAIAAFTIVNRVVFFGTSIVLGTGQGFQPVCGFNYGAGRYDRVREAFRFSVIVGTVSASVFALSTWMNARSIIAAFRSDEEVIRIGVETLRMQCTALPFLGFATMMSMLLQNLKITGPATFLGAARQGIFFIPALLIGEAAAGLTGLELSQPIADICTFLCALPMQRYMWRTHLAERRVH